MNREPTPVRRTLAQVLVLVAVAIALGLVTDAVRADRVFFPRPVPVLKTVPVDSPR